MEQPSSLTRLAAEQVDAARASTSGRSTTIVTGGPHTALRLVLLALRSGATLSEHDNPGEATLQVLSGGVQVTSGNEQWNLAEGDVLALPQARHAVLAHSDTAVLLTVVPRSYLLPR